MMSKYRKALVTFIDILGFAELSSKENYDRVEAILKTVQETTRYDPNIQKTYETESFTFSDSVVRICPIDSQTNKEIASSLLFLEVMSLAHIQARLTHHNILIRGAITLGEISFNEGRLFGPAMVRAYRLESQLAQHPRIIIDPLLFEEFQREALLQKDTHGLQEAKERLEALVKPDSDGLWFIDYLRAMAGETENIAEYYELLDRHRQNLETRLTGSRDPNRVSIKSMWLANYHNASIDGCSPAAFASEGLELSQLKVKRVWI